MWKLLKFIGAAIKAIFWLLLVSLLLVLAALYVLEREIPSPLMQRLTDKLSNDDIHLRVERATFNLKKGIRFQRVKAFPKRHPHGALVSADEVAVRFSLAPHLALNERIKSVTIRNLSVPDLPPDAPKDEQPPGEKPDVTLPALPAFPVTLESLDILGVKASRITATVETSEKNARVSDILIQWPDKTFQMAVAGWAEADFTSRKVSGRVKGQAFPSNILPLLHALRARGAIRQIDCFSAIARPIDVAAEFNVDIDSSDFALELDLDVGPCRYRDVPMAFARGRVSAHGTNVHTTVTVDRLQAQSETGPIAGRLVYSDETEGVDIDATANMDITQLAAIINVLNQGELNRIRCLTPASTSVKGVIAASSKYSSVTNDLAGRLAFGQGSILNFRVSNVAGDLAINGYTARISNVSGTAAHGGRVSGEVMFHFPDYAATATVFNADIQLADVDLSDLSEAFNVTNDRAGLVTGNLVLGGSTHKDTLATLNGGGKVKIRDGLIHRMRLFAGFTDYLARNIPGVSSLVNQSTGSMDFTIRDGVLATDNLLLEGNIFSLQGRGTYNINTDHLDFIVRANVFRQKTLAGRITHFVTMPFARLLLEFRVFGSLDNPDWSYVSILERITDQFSDPTRNPATPETAQPQPETP